MKRTVTSFLSVVMVISSFHFSIIRANASQDNTILWSGQPPLTQTMINKLEAIYKFLLEIRLTRIQHQRFQQGVVEYWAKNNRKAMQETLSNLKYYDQRDELTSLRDSSQKVFVESLRRETEDAVAVVLVEAYDWAHPERIAATRAKGFADLIGVWKREDALLAPRRADGSVIGVGYTDSRTLEILANGHFKLMKVHNHYSGSGGCSTLSGSTEYGTVFLEGGKLVFNIQSGSEVIKDGCNPALSRQGSINSHKESFAWSIRSNPNNNRATMLCWNTGQDSAECYEKQ